MKFLKLKKLKLSKFQIFLILILIFILLVNGTNILCKLFGLGKKCNKVKLNMNSFSDQAIIENMENFEEDDNLKNNSEFAEKLQNLKDKRDDNLDIYSSVPTTGQDTHYNSAYSNSNNLSDIIYTDNGGEILATPQNTVMGVPKNKIPPGQEDLYILKSEIVPPVCPACPPVIVDKNLIKDKPPPPCPPCERCPEPSFTCKKVPNYESKRTNDTLPKPLLNDFSQFAM